MTQAYIKRYHQLTEKQLAYTISAFGMFLAAWVMFIQHGWINDDSVLYFEMARLISAGQFQDAIKLFNWPLYPSLIALIHKLTTFGIHTSAQILNAGLFSLCCYGFVRLIQTCGGGEKVVGYATLLLFSSIYIVGDVLPMLLRDQGFWAFSMLSYLFLIRFYHKQKLQDAIFWQISIIIATLFRVEGISLLVGLPFVLLFNQQHDFRSRAKQYIIANAFFLLTASALLIAISALNIMQVTDLGRLNEAISFIKGSYIETANRLASKSESLGHNILGSFLDDYSLLAFCTGLLSIVIVKAISTTGWLVSLIILVGNKCTTLAMLPEAKKVLIWAMCIHFLNMLLIITSAYVLSGRYIIGFSLVVIIFAGFYLAKLFENTPESGLIQKYQKAFRIALLLIVSISFIKIILPKSADYNYEQDAVAWVKHKNTANFPVFYTSPRARFYANQPYQGRGYDFWQYTQSAIENKIYQKYNYLVINIDKEHLKDEAELNKAFAGYTKATEFFGAKGKKKIIVFEKNT
jgi:Dolichyl-phosphate-mannose-protein mannosyltransferase